MTKTEAESVIKGEKQITDFFTDFSRDSQPEEVEKEPETGGNTGNPEEENSQIPKNDTNAGNEDTDQGPEKPEESKVEKKKPFTPIEKQRHAFKVEKNKRREVEAQLKAREYEIAKLKEQLEKYKDLTLEDFKGDTGAYTDYKVDQRLGKEQVDRWSAEIENQRRQMDMQEAAELADYRCQQCFPDETERNKYQELIQMAESNFANMHPEIGYQKSSDF